MDMKAPNPKANKEVPTYKKLSIREQVAVIDLLREHCSSKGEFAVYAAGWDDAAIATAAGATGIFPDKSVARIRKELFGQLRRSPSIAASNVERLAWCENAIKLLAEHLGETLPERFL